MEAGAEPEAIFELGDLTVDESGEDDLSLDLVTSRWMIYLLKMILLKCLLQAMMQNRKKMLRTI